MLKNHSGSTRCFCWFIEIFWLSHAIQRFKSFKLYKKLWVFTFSHRKQSQIDGIIVFSTGNRNNDRSLFLWYYKAWSVRHTIGSRCIVYSFIGEHIHTNVFGAYAVPETRAIVYAWAPGWTLWHISILSNKCCCLCKFGTECYFFHVISFYCVCRFPVWSSNQSYLRQFVTFWLICGQPCMRLCWHRCSLFSSWTLPRHVVWKKSKFKKYHKSLHEFSIAGYFFSIAFKSVDMAIAYLVPFDVSLMITSGVFIKLRWAMQSKAKTNHSIEILFQLNCSSIPFILSWLHHISWLKYANEAMTIIQWEGVTNISNFAFFFLNCWMVKFKCIFAFDFSMQSQCSNLSTIGRRHFQPIWL